MIHVIRCTSFISDEQFEQDDQFQCMNFLVDFLAAEQTD